jgi:photosystem II stability/assembly factor-like uncharacterized protein
MIPKTFRKVLLVALMLVLCFGQFSPVSAGTEPDVWRPIDFGGIEIYSLLVDPLAPTTLYVATQVGLFKSVNGGTLWKVSEKGVFDTIHVLTFDPLSSSVIYGGTSKGRVYKSTDGGESWNVLNNGLPSKEIRAVAVSPASSKTLYAGIFGEGMFRSIDGGENWVAINSGLASKGVTCLVIDSVNPNILYAGTTEGVFKSLNGGEAWGPMNIGFVDSFNVSWLVMDPTSPITLYAGMVDDGVFKTVTGGIIWTELIGPMAPLNATFLTFSRSAPFILYATTLANGVFRSLDGGASWVPFNTGGRPSGTFGKIFFDPLTPSILYGGGINGVLKSVDAGNHWEEINEGITYGAIKAMSIDPKKPTNLYAIYEYDTDLSYFMKSINGGIDWIVSSRGLDKIGVNDFVIDPKTPSNLYATYLTGVYKSTNAGDNWNKINVGLPPEPTILSLNIDPVTPTTLYLTGGEGIYRSTNGGGLWTILFDSTSINSIAIDPKTPTTLYASGSSLYKSTDGGKNWLKKEGGFPESAYANLVVVPATPNIIYAGTKKEGMFKSVDSGDNWLAINNGLDNLNVNAVAIDPLDPSIVYAGTDEGVYVSQDGGKNWHKNDAGMMNIKVLSLAVSPESPVTIYAGTDGRGIYSVSTFPLSGRVTFNGEGLPDVKVQLKNFRETLTDTNGNFLFIDCPGLNFTYTIMPSKDGYYFTPISREYSEGTARSGLDFAAFAYPTTTLSGRITYKGEGLPGVTIKSSSGVEAISDVVGNFVFPDWPTIGGPYTLTPKKAGYIFSPERRIVEKSSPKIGNNFSAWLDPRTVNLSGQITFNGVGLAGVNVKNGDGIEAITDAKGYYLLFGMKPGKYIITPTKLGYRFTPASLVVSMLSNKKDGNFTAEAVPISHYYLPVMIRR